MFSLCFIIIIIYFFLFCRLSNISIEISHTYQPLLHVTSPVYYNYLLLHISIHIPIISFSFSFFFFLFSLIIDYLFIQSIGAGLVVVHVQELSVGRQYINENDEDMYEKGEGWLDTNDQAMEMKIYIYRIDWFIETLISNNSKLFAFSFYCMFEGAKKVFRDVINCRKYFSLRKKNKTK